MKLGFNTLNSGLGNNGGSRTIILSQKALEELGYQCDIVTTVNRFSWFGFKPPINHIPPDLDVLIATACTTVKSTLGSNALKKAWWIRLHETHTYSEKELIDLYRLPKKLNIVNSFGLKGLLGNFGVDSQVIYQGIDFNWWKSLSIRKEKIRIGCLYSKKPRKRWRDFVKLSKILGKAYEFVAYGDSKCPNDFLTEYLSNPSVDQLNELYNSCHIWFSPTEFEGLHNVSMEAALCGCLIVCSNFPLNGQVFDYAFKNKTAMVYETLDEAVELVKNPNWALISAMQKQIKTHIGSRETNMKKLVSLFSG